MHYSCPQKDPKGHWVGTAQGFSTLGAVFVTGFCWNWVLSVTGEACVCVNTLYLSDFTGHYVS